MNLTHLKYAVEVDKTRSITRAAENLSMGQPNLSRCIKELEDALGIVLFRRTSKGITPTAQGEEFLADARRVLAQIEEGENHDDDRGGFQHFRAPRQLHHPGVHPPGGRTGSLPPHGAAL